MRVVLDTNVLIAAFITPRGAPSQLIKLWTQGDFEIVTSRWQIEEFRCASRYDRVKQRVSAAEVGAFINALRQNALVLEQLPSIDLSPDPDDNNILATALAGGAHYLVTGDKADLQTLKKIEHVRIVTVQAFKRLRS